MTINATTFAKPTIPTTVYPAAVPISLVWAVPAMKQDIPKTVHPDPVDITLKWMKIDSSTLAKPTIPSTVHPDPVDIPLRWATINAQQFAKPVIPDTVKPDPVDIPLKWMTVDATTLAKPEIPSTVHPDPVDITVRYGPINASTLPKPEIPATSKPETVTVPIDVTARIDCKEIKPDYIARLKKCLELDVLRMPPFKVRTKAIIEDCTELRKGFIKSVTEDCLDGIKSIKLTEPIKIKASVELEIDNLSEAAEKSLIEVPESRIILPTPEEVAGVTSGQWKPRSNVVPAPRNPRHNAEQPFSGAGEFVVNPSGRISGPGMYQSYDPAPVAPPQRENIKKQVEAAISGLKMSIPLTAAVKGIDPIDPALIAGIPTVILTGSITSIDPISTTLIDTIPDVPLSASITQVGDTGLEAQLVAKTSVAQQVLDTNTLTVTAASFTPMAAWGVDYIRQIPELQQVLNDYPLTITAASFTPMAAWAVDYIHQIPELQQVLNDHPLSVVAGAATVTDVGTAPDIKDKVDASLPAVQKELLGKLYAEICDVKICPEMQTKVDAVIPTIQTMLSAKPLYVEVCDIIRCATFQQKMDEFLTQMQKDLERPIKKEPTWEETNKLAGELFLKRKGKGDAAGTEDWYEAEKQLRNQPLAVVIGDVKMADNLLATISTMVEKIQEGLDNRPLTLTVGNVIPGSDLTKNLNDIIDLLNKGMAARPIQAHIDSNLKVDQPALIAQLGTLISLLQTGLDARPLKAIIGDIEMLPGVTDKLEKVILAGLQAGLDARPLTAKLADVTALTMKVDNLKLMPVAVDDLTLKNMTVNVDALKIKSKKAATTSGGAGGVYMPPVISHDETPKDPLPHVDR
jgi:hypothetical protein